MSTESGIPDYRSPSGSYSKGHKPVTHNEFISSEKVRARYWARSVSGIEYFNKARPNRAHYSLSQLERKGFISHVITQNVDRLHQASGAEKVLEIHGNGHGVACLECRTEFSRKGYTEDLREQNQAFFEQIKQRREQRLYHRAHGADDVQRAATVDLSEADASLQRADGDAAIEEVDFSDFSVVPCYACGGVLMPTIVFFGGFVPPEVKEKATQLVTESTQLLILGSTVQTFSCFRLVKQAVEEGKDVGIINYGPTRADEIATWKIESALGDILSASVP